MDIYIFLEVKLVDEKHIYFYKELYFAMFYFSRKNNIYFWHC